MKSRDLRSCEVKVFRSHLAQVEGVLQGLIPRLRLEGWPQRSVCAVDTIPVGVDGLF